MANEDDGRGLMICRCEEVLLDRDLQEVWCSASSLDEVKRATRIGMGVCQGRVCRPLLQRLALAWGDELGRDDPDEPVVGGISNVELRALRDQGPSIPGYRNPVRPVTLRKMGRLEDPPQA